MTNRQEDDQLENAIEALVSGGDVPLAGGSEVAELGTVVSRLRDLPSSSFRARLTADLRRHAEGQPKREQRWGFLTNHALVLIHVGNHPRSTLREISAAVGITERAALSILRQMEEEGIVSRQKEGRRNRYWVDFRALLTHQLSGPYNIEQLVQQVAHLAGGLASSDAGWPKELLGHANTSTIQVHSQTTDEQAGAIDEQDRLDDK